MEKTDTVESKSEVRTMINERDVSRDREIDLRVMQEAREESSGQPGSRESDPPNGGPAKKMSRAEAGRKGGLATKKRYGDKYFSEIGRLGGKKGGEATKQKYGVEFYQEIGRRGGSR